MTIIQIFNNSLKKIFNTGNQIIFNKLKISNLNPVIYLALIILFTITYFTITNINSKTYEKNSRNFKIITKSKEFSSITDFFISKINSPYKEIRYSIKNNDTLEKILKKFDVKNEDIAEISSKLKNRNLSYIYSGREISLILKETGTQTNTLINLFFPINNTTSVEVRKVKDKFIIKENIIRLNKKETVVKNVIKDNLSYLFKSDKT